MVMQAAHHRLCNEPDMLRRLHRTWLGSIVTQPEGENVAPWVNPVLSAIISQSVVIH